eukprot:gene43151-52742_t
MTVDQATGGRKEENPSDEVIYTQVVRRDGNRDHDDGNISSAFRATLPEGRESGSSSSGIGDEKEKETKSNPRDFTSSQLASRPNYASKLGSTAVSPLSSSATSSFALSQISLHTVPTLPGVFIVRNFLTEEEELAIVRMLDGDPLTPWKPSSFNGQCRSKVYGVRTQFGLPQEERLVRENDVSKGEFDIPQFLRQFAERVRVIYAACMYAHDGPSLDAIHRHQVDLPSELAAFDPNDCNANSYLKSRGDFLKLHYDDRALSGPLLLNVSM